MTRGARNCGPAQAVAQGAARERQAGADHAAVASGSGSAAGAASAAPSRWRPVFSTKTSSSVGSWRSRLATTKPASSSDAHHAGDVAGAARDGDREVAPVGGRPGRAEPREDVARVIQVVLGVAVGQRDVEVRVADVGLQLRGRVLGDDEPARDDPDAVGELVGLLEVLRGQEDRGALVLEAADLVPEGDPAHRVQARGGLVEEEHLGLVDERHREVQAAAHAAGVGADTAVLGLGEPDALDQLRGAAAHGAGRDAVQRGLELHELLARHEHVERRLLERDADAPAHLVRLGRRRRTRRRARGPPVGRRSVTSIRTVVVLPAPLGPRKP